MPRRATGQDLARAGRTVLGVDRSRRMLALAAGRMPGAVARGDAARLPVRDAAADAVVLSWLLHLLPDPAPVLAEAARVLRPGGVLVTTVDKDAAMLGASDVAALVAPLRSRHAPPAADRFGRVTALAAAHGLRPAGDSSYPGIGQGRTPRQWRDRLAAGVVPWARTADPAEIAELCRDLETLPGQDLPRPEPRYRLIALSREHPRGDGGPAGTNP